MFIDLKISTTLYIAREQNFFLTFYGIVTKSAIQILTDPCANLTLNINPRNGDILLSILKEILKLSFYIIGTNMYEYLLNPSQWYFSMNADD